MQFKLVVVKMSNSEITIVMGQWITKVFGPLVVDMVY